MASREKTLHEVIKLIRRNFWLLKAVSDNTIEDLNLSASTRAILEHLHESGSCTVPQIATAKTVTRQSIQALADQLQDLGYIDFVPNPNHKRSQLLQMTELGRKTFATVCERDAILLRQIAVKLEKTDLTATEGLLRELKNELAEMNEEIKNEHA